MKSLVLLYVLSPLQQLLLHISVIMSDYEYELNNTEINNDAARQAEDERKNACHSVLATKITASQ